MQENTVVRLVDLASQPALNGTHGRVLSWDAGRERLGVEVTVDGVRKSLALRPANVDTSIVELDRLRRDAAGAHQAAAHVLTLALYDAYIAREPRDAKAHLRKATALEKLGRPRDAYDALLLGQRATHGDARLAFDTARLADMGMHAGWMQFSAASDEQSAARSSQPHCALCLRPTPAGRPPPEASCGVCGMVQYCCAEHCAADADKHGRQCATLQKLAWRQLWSHCMQQQAASRSRV